jgi:hypothetical protein
LKCEQIKGNAVYLCLTFNHDISGFLIQKLIFLAIEKVFLGPGTFGALLTFWTSCSVGRCYSFLVKVGAVYVFKILLLARASVARGDTDHPTLNTKIVLLTQIHTFGINFNSNILYTACMQEMLLKKSKVYLKQTRRVPYLIPIQSGGSYTCLRYRTKNGALKLSRQRFNAFPTSGYKYGTVPVQVLHTWLYLLFRRRSCFPV